MDVCDLGTTSDLLSRPTTVQLEPNVAERWTTVSPIWRSWRGLGQKSDGLRSPLEARLSPALAKVGGRVFEIPWPHWIVVSQSVGSLSDHIAQRLAPAYSKDPLGLIRQRGSKPPIRERNNFNVGDVLSVLYPITKPTFGKSPVSGRLMTDQGRKFLA